VKTKKTRIRGGAPSKIRLSTPYYLLRKEVDRFLARTMNTAARKSLPKVGSRGPQAIGAHQGAPQESDDHAACVPFCVPEILKATTQLGTAESDDGVGALNRPVHSGAFEARADGYLAPGLTTPVEVHKPCAWNSG